MTLEQKDQGSSLVNMHMITCNYVILDTSRFFVIYIYAQHSYHISGLYGKEVVMNLMQQVIIFMDTAYYCHP